MASLSVCRGWGRKETNRARFFITYYTITIGTKLFRRFYMSCLLLEVIVCQYWQLTITINLNMKHCSHNWWKLIYMWLNTLVVSLEFRFNILNKLPTTRHNRDELTYLVQDSPYTKTVIEAHGWLAYVRQQTIPSTKTHQRLRDFGSLARVWLPGDDI